MIRFVSADDALEIAAIYNHYVEHTTISFETEVVDVDEMRCCIDDVSSIYPYFVSVDDDGRIEGYCYAHRWKERAAYHATLETTVYLRPDCCGRGLGRKLMNRLIGECRERGVHALIACITADNHASVALHKCLGFEAVSHFREVGCKFGRRLDVIDMELLL